MKFLLAASILAQPLQVLGQHEQVVSLSLNDGGRIGHVAEELSNTSAGSSPLLRKKQQVKKEEEIALEDIGEWLATENIHHEKTLVLVNERPVACNPKETEEGFPAVDTGLLSLEESNKNDDCGMGAVCEASIDSPLGGFCVIESSEKGGLIREGRSLAATGTYKGYYQTCTLDAGGSSDCAYALVCSSTVGNRCISCSTAVESASKDSSIVTCTAGPTATECEQKCLGATFPVLPAKTCSFGPGSTSDCFVGLFCSNGGDSGSSTGTCTDCIQSGAFDSASNTCSSAVATTAQELADCEKSCVLKPLPHGPDGGGNSDGGNSFSISILGCSGGNFLEFIFCIIKALFGFR